MTIIQNENGSIEVKESYNEIKEMIRSEFIGNKDAHFIELTHGSRRVLVNVKTVLHIRENN